MMSAYCSRNLALSCIALLVAARAVAAPPQTFPTETWEEAPPASQGVDPHKLQAAAELLARTVGNDAAKELVIIKNGRLIWRGDDIDKRHGVWSATKSFTSTVLGLLIEDGKCTLDTRLADVLPEMKDHYPEVTLRHLTTMTSGYRAVGDTTTGTYKHGPSSTPFQPNAMPLFTPPGSQYAYWDSAMNVLGLALTRIAGEPLETLFRRRIAEPIGMRDWDWGDYATINSVVVNGGSGNSSKHIFISAGEMARFGLLMLNKGNWNGRQLLSADWIEQATSVQVLSTVPWAQPESEIDGRGVYGFNWWTNGIKPDGHRKFPGAPKGLFWASGHNNNKCFVIPEWNMVIVRQGLDGRAKDEVWNGFLSQVSAAVTDAGKVGKQNSSLPAEQALETPRPLLRLEELGRQPRNNYGSLEATIQLLRAYRPLDLNAAQWRRQHPTANHDQWARQARALLAEGLHYDSGKLELNAITTDRWETESFVRETIEFNTTPWFRVPGYFYVPKNVPLPAPALVVFHEWGGPILFGADRVSGEPVHPAIVEHRNRNTSGRALADWFASQGYAVIVIDAYHFGRRAPRGLNGLPEAYDPATLDEATLKRYDALVRDSLYLGVRQLNWAGTTWAGVNYGDDSRCVDYLLSRKEVDPERIGCTGLSGGGWRTNIMAALEPRIKAAVSVGWMTTGDAQQPYNVSGAIGTFCLLPGVWNRIDIPDLVAMAAPKAVMVVSGTKDALFPPLGQREAAQQIADAYAWANCQERFRDYAPDKEHCYDADLQNEALAWFDAHLKQQRTPRAGKPAGP